MARAPGAAARINRAAAVTHAAEVGCPHWFARKESARCADRPALPAVLPMPIQTYVRSAFTRPVKTLATMVCVPLAAQRIRFAAMEPAPARRASTTNVRCVVTRVSLVARKRFRVPPPFASPTPCAPAAAAARPAVALGKFAASCPTRRAPMEPSVSPTALAQGRRAVVAAAKGVWGSPANRATQRSGQTSLRARPSPFRCATRATPPPPHSCRRT
jgi:hypothetical protein